MPSIQVDFYLLSEDNPDAFLVLACRLLEKAYHQKLAAWVWCSNDTDAAALDSRLWTFKEESFVPHARYDEARSERAPIEIATDYPPLSTAQLLVNLSSEIVQPLPGLERIIEIVPPKEIEKEKSRTHYRAYRQAGYNIKTHSI